VTIRYVVLDLELTDRNPELAHVVEWAAIVVEPAWFGIPPRVTAGGLVKPPIPIPPETSAIHHIIDADVRNAPTWEQAQLEIIDLLQDDPEVILVGHTVATERTMLAPLGLKCSYLCTHKAALRTWPDAPAFSNECLRYYLGFGTGRSKPQAPHSARHDAEVTALLLEALLAADVNPLDMIEWTDEPAMLPRCPIGTYRGEKWADIPSDFLDWILFKIHDREDLRFCAKRELDRRDEEDRKELEAATATAGATAGTATEDNDIPF
jgi:exodeoxyribonuclease X